MTNETIAVPCGKCPKCKKRRVSSWSFRLLMESKFSESAHFITLTYDTDHAPLTRNGYMGLCKRDLQLFFKRLRKADNSGRQIKYFAVGEYGGKTYRPHYHIILFNADIKLIQPAWQNGEVHYGKVEGASVGYCLKYISKEGKIPMHRNDDRIPQFSLMSKGLGLQYITEEMKEWHLADLTGRMYCNLEDGKKISMPRYYKDKIYHPTQRKAISYHSRKESVEMDEKNRRMHRSNLGYEEEKVIRIEAAKRKMKETQDNHCKI